MASALRKPAQIPRKPMGIARTSTGKSSTGQVYTGKVQPAKKRKNPLDKAAEMSEAFHGRPARHVTEIVERLKAHGVLAEIGPLTEIGIVDGKYEIPIEFKGVTLATSEDGKQLYAVGGDQQVSLKALGIEAQKDSVVLGEAASITYVTAKFHLGREDRKPGPYRHVFAEEGGEGPIVTYDCLNRQIAFHGGTYRIDVDMDGKYSAGIRD